MTLDNLKDIINFHFENNLIDKSVSLEDPQPDEITAKYLYVSSHNYTKLKEDGTNMTLDEIDESIEDENEKEALWDKFAWSIPSGAGFEAYGSESEAGEDEDEDDGDDEASKDGQAEGPESPDLSEDVKDTPEQKEEEEDEHQESLPEATEEQPAANLGRVRKIIGEIGIDTFGGLAANKIDKTDEDGLSTVTPETEQQ